MSLSFFSIIHRLLPLLAITLYVAALTVGSFTGGLWAALGIGGALLMYVGTWIAQHKLPRVDPTITLFVFVFVIIVALLNLYAVSPSVSGRALLQQISILAPLVLLSSAQVQKNIQSPQFFPLVVVAAFVGALALAMEYSLGSPLLHFVKGAQVSVKEYNRGVTYLVGMTLPLVAYLWLTNRRWAAVALVITLFIPAILTESRTTKFALIFGLMTIAAGKIAPVFVRYCLIAVLVSLLALPFLVTNIFVHHPSWTSHLPDSWQHRSEIWDYMSYRIFERPWLGWGIGSSHLLPYQDPHGATYVFVKSVASHPHNVIIQLWVELGVLGLALGMFFALLMLFRASRLPTQLVPFALGTWVAVLCICLVGYDFWNDSLLSFIAMTALTFRLLVRQVSTNNTATDKRS